MTRAGALPVLGHCEVVAERIDHDCHRSIGELKGFDAVERVGSVRTSRAISTTRSRRRHDKDGIVRSCATIDRRIGTDAAIQCVIAAGTGEAVVADAAVEQVGAVAAGEDVRAGAAGDREILGKGEANGIARGVGNRTGKAGAAVKPPITAVVEAE